MYTSFISPSFSQEPRPCSNDVDVAFVVDSSRRVNEANYRREKNFVKIVAKNLGVSPGGTRAALVLYSSFARIFARFQQYPTFAEFQKIVEQLPHGMGKTKIDQALDLTATQIFPEARSDVPKIAIVLTTGTWKNAATNLAETSEYLRNMGVRVLVVGIGRDVSFPELRSMVGNKGDVFLVRDFSELVLRSKWLSDLSCETKGW